MLALGMALPASIRGTADLVYVVSFCRHHRRDLTLAHASLSRGIIAVALLLTSRGSLPTRRNWAAGSGCAPSMGCAPMPMPDRACSRSGPRARGATREHRILRQIDDAGRITGDGNRLSAGDFRRSRPW